MKHTILATILAAPAIVIGALFFGIPTANAINPVDCAFNPAVAKAHAAECKDVSVESVASNGGNAGHDDDGDGVPNGEDPTPLG